MEPEFDQEVQTEARNKNILCVVYKSRDGVDLPEASTFTLHATPDPILYEWLISFGRGFSQYNLAVNDEYFAAV